MINTELLSEKLAWLVANKKHGEPLNFADEFVGTGVIITMVCGAPLEAYARYIARRMQADPSAELVYLMARGHHVANAERLETYLTQHSGLALYNRHRDSQQVDGDLIPTVLITMTNDNELAALAARASALKAEGHQDEVETELQELSAQLSATS